MKKFLTAALFGVLVAVPAFSVELSRASNDELLQEVRSRMGGGNGGGGSEQAIASYTCDTSNSLRIDLLSSAGKTESKSFYLGSSAHCMKHATVLSRNKTKIRSLTLIAICTTSNELARLPLLTSGKFGEQQSTYIGNADACMAQASAINEGN